MRFTTRWSGTTVTLGWEPEAGDTLTYGPATLVGRSARFHLPVEVGPADVHPDVEALLALMIVGPFSRTIRMDRGVSTGFAEVLAAHHSRTVLPVDPGLAPRVAPAGGHVGLAFSAGADSSAALALLPDDTVPCFMNRITAPGGTDPTRYSAKAALHMVRGLRDRGRRVLVVDTDLVHARKPVGFTTAWVNAAPLLLLADVERLDAMAWGIIAESAYHTGHERFGEWRDRQDGPWGLPFAAVGLPMCQPVAGVSEVGTARIVRAWEHGDLAQSCQLGDVGAPCRNCWKCFRKLLLDAALSGDWPGDAEVDVLLRSDQARRTLAHYPIKHENVVAWMLRGYRGTHPVLRQLVGRTRAATLDLGWMERTYGPAIETLPEGRRESVRERLAGYLDPMTPADEAAMRAWDMTAFLEDPATKAAHAELVRLLKPYGPPRRPLHRRILSGIRRRLPGRG